MTPRPRARRTVLKTIGAGVVGGVALSGTGAAHGDGLKRELAEVRSATAAYADTQNAMDAGYVPGKESVCGMGFHWPNPDRLDMKLNKAEPEFLAYGEDDDGDLVLGAVEYAVPVSGEFAESPPDLFDNADPEWHILPLPENAPFPFDRLWTLHAWVHNHNPEGVFHPTNPRELFHPDGCEGGGDH